MFCPFFMHPLAYIHNIIPYLAVRSLSLNLQMQAAEAGRGKTVNTNTNTILLISVGETGST